MNSRLVLPSLLLSLSLQNATATPTGGSPPGPADDAISYCEYVHAVAQSESGPLMLPALVGTIGEIHEAETVFGQRTGDILRARATVSLHYSLGQLYRGVLVRRAADADCERYRAQSVLRRFLEAGPKATSRRALGARLRVLVESLPDAQSMSRDMERAVREGNATVAERQAFDVRLHALQTELFTTREELQGLPEVAGPPEDIPALLAARASEEQKAEVVQGSLRRSRAWDIALQGGYDKAFGAGERVPLFGFVTASFNLGYFWQRPADERAVERRRDWVEREAEGVSERARQALREMEATLESSRARLAQTRPLLASVRERYETARAIRSERIASYRNLLWFDLVALRAEQEYLEARVEDLAGVLRIGSGTPHP